MLARSRWLGVLAVPVVAALVTVLGACGGKGGEPGAPPATVEGNWTVTETGTSNTCGDAVDPPYAISIAQNGGAITVTTPAGSFNGTISGNVVTWSGSYPDNGGTTTITSLRATVFGNTISGTSTWTWSQGSVTCGGTTTFSGALTVAGPSTFTVGGSVSGLTGGTVVLQNNGGNDLSRGGNGAFVFAGTVTAGSSYLVTVKTQPAGQTCLVSDGSGVANANVSNVVVACSTQTFTLTTGVTGSGSVSRSPNQATYAAGTKVVLTAAPQPGSTFSSWSGGLTGARNPDTVTMSANISVTANFVATSNKLTVVKAGLGSGTVTGTGINCGIDCTENFTSGSIALTATAATGSTFDSWTGCTSVTTNVCTVNMSAPHTVTVTFNTSITLSAPTVSVPATSSNGSYGVTVNCTGLCSTTFVLQEAPTTAFVNPTQTTFANASFPKIIAFTGKAAGTYCYRAAFTVPNWGAPSCVTVSPPSTAVLRITNTSSYDLIDVRLNNSQKVSYPYAILSGQSADFLFTGAGTVTLALGNGFYNSDQSRGIWFTLSGTTTVTLGQTTTVTFANPTIGQLLTNFTSTRNWDGMYFDANTNSYFKRFRFTSSTNGWQLYNSTAPCFGGTTCSFSLVSSGTVRLIAWPRYSSIVTFDFGSGTPQASIAYPFGSFQYQNGPASWTIIEYIMQ